jgi:4-aminobutyrate aminotransferase-like enzyme
LTHVGKSFATEEIQQVLSKLSTILPSSLNRTVFLNTGSEAVELALKMARAATGKSGVIALERGYYGATSYALALSESGRNAAYLPHPGDLLRLPTPHCSHCPVKKSPPCEGLACIDDYLENLGNIAAVLYEPIMAVGGVIVPPPGYGARLRTVADQAQALLIAEEVSTGIGRTGRWFGFEHEAIVPDILVLGKALGAGLPVAAVITTEDVEALCQGVLRHVQSHQNDPFSASLVQTVLSVIEEEDLLQRVRSRSAFLTQGLRVLESQFPLIEEVRGNGLMLGIQVEETQAAYAQKIAESLLHAGYILDYQSHTSTYRLFPPYIISSPEIERFLGTFEGLLGR